MAASPYPHSSLQTLEETTFRKKERSGKVGRSMENNGPADHGGRQRRGADYADVIATIHFLEKILLKIMIGAIGIMGVPTITILRTIVCIHTVLVIVGRLLILNMGRQDMDPGFQLTFACIAVLGCVKCCLLVYIPLCVMPWPIFVLRILSLMNP